MALSELHQSKRGLAIVATCIVQTLNESDPTFKDRFLARLKAAYYEVRDNSDPDPNLHNALESITWVQELLTGFDRIHGSGEPFLGNYEPS